VAAGRKAGRLTAIDRSEDRVMAINRAMGPAEWLLLVALSVLWGGSFFFSKVALAELPPFTVVLGRVGLAAVALVVMVLGSGQRLPRSLRLWGAFLVMGALNNLIPFSLIVWGQTAIASGLAAILNATTPLFTVVLAHLLTRDERMTPGRLSGVVLGLLGVALMIGPAALAGLGVAVVAQLACLAAALSYALAGIFGRRFRGTPPLVTAAGQVSMSTLLILPLALVVDRPWSLPPPGPSTWGVLIALALLSTALAYILYFRILAAVGATNLLLVTFLIPVSALVLGIRILGERLAPGHLAGMALIALGLAAIDGRPLAWRARLRRRMGPGPVQLRP
jgi:drug/metabolite transporter (DMT)-like permease